MPTPTNKSLMARCQVPDSQRARRALCLCGGMNTIKVVVEYTENGRIDYTGGRFCYVAHAGIDIRIPDGATPIQAMIFDLHQPNEIIRITFRRKADTDAE